ncbi:hypothetical protein SLEP1_g31646 [Rubroshorea leprosula]|uniref:Uncharacterized protein n=1 Tax=Rubroshorea leprosula TaxID=152421 RepID=A0AAV5KA53_9ROSI|nr:hypothetical protein SLEP1_g31646 [Rubroshorea leprosula]
MRVVRSGGAGSLRRGVLVQTSDQMRVCLLWLSYTHDEVPREKRVVRSVKLPWLINENCPKVLPKANFLDCVFLN